MSINTVFKQDKQPLRVPACHDVPLQLSFQAVAALALYLTRGLSSVNNSMPPLPCGDCSWRRESFSKASLCSHVSSFCYMGLLML